MWAARLTGAPKRVSVRATPECKKCGRVSLVTLGTTIRTRAVAKIFDIGDPDPPVIFERLYKGYSAKVGPAAGQMKREGVQCGISMVTLPGG